MWLAQLLWGHPVTLDDAAITKQSKHSTDDVVKKKHWDVKAYAGTCIYFTTCPYPKWHKPILRMFKVLKNKITCEYSPCSPTSAVKFQWSHPACQIDLMTCWQKFLKVPNNMAWKQLQLILANFTWVFSSNDSAKSLQVADTNKYLVLLPPTTSTWPSCNCKLDWPSLSIGNNKKVKNYGYLAASKR